jgi:tRNA pseudouridine38-40 synthase
MRRGSIGCMFLTFFLLYAERSWTRIFKSFDTWINAVDDYSGNDFHYLNPKGVIPTSAVISKGHRRQGQFLEPLKKNLKGDAPGVGGNSDEEVDESLLRSAEMEG